MNMRSNIADKIIAGSILALGLAEALHLTVLFAKLPFSVFAVAFAILLLVGIGAGLVWTFLKSERGISDSVKAGKQAPITFCALFRAYPGWVLLVLGMILFQIVFNYVLHVPYIRGDITVETVQTMLATDSIYEVNPLTGQPFAEGMPLRLKVLVLPTVYAAVCKWTGLSAVTVCCRMMPMLFLLLSYLVYTRWAVYLFPTERKKQIWFMLFVTLIYQFGSYSEFMDGFLLLFNSGQGEAFRVCVLLPYSILCCLQKNRKRLVLCLLAEVCVVWTLYGLGFVAVTTVMIELIRLFKYLADRRKKV